MSVNMLKVVIVAVLAGYLYAVSASHRALMGPGETITVISARDDLQPGTVLAEDMLETRTLPRLYMQQDSFVVRSMSDMRLPVGLTVAVRIPKGDQVTKNCLAGSAAQPPAADKKTLSQEYYVDGLRCFQNSDFVKARERWQAAVEADPANADALAGLKRLEMILSPDKK